MNESVTVTEAAPLLKTESGELSHNRLFLSTPTAIHNGANNGPNAAPTVRTAKRALLSGYGFVSTFNGAGSRRRTEQIVARFSF